MLILSSDVPFDQTLCCQLMQWGATNHSTAPHDTPRHPTSLNYVIVLINYLTKLLQSTSFMNENLFLY